MLQLAGRHTRFLGLFNFDFIAFGKWNQSKKGNPYLRTPSALQFFTDFVNSQFADSFSLYTLELFENQARKRKKSDALISGAYFGTDEQIYEEFSLLIDMSYQILLLQENLVSIIELIEKWKIISVWDSTHLHF